MKKSHLIGLLFLLGCVIFAEAQTPTETQNVYIVNQQEIATKLQAIQSQLTASTIISSSVITMAVDPDSATLQGNKIQISTLGTGIQALYDAKVNASSYTLQGNLITISTVAGGVNQLANGLMNASSYTLQGNLVTISTVASGVNQLANGLMNASSYTLQGNLVTISTVAFGVNELYGARVNASSYTLQGNRVNISTTAQGVQALYDAKVNASSYTMQGPRVSSITQNQITADHLKVTNAPGDGQVLTYDDDTRTFTWADDQAGAGGGGASAQAYKFVVGTAASQFVTHITTDETGFIAVSTTLQTLGGGTFMVREGSYGVKNTIGISSDVTCLGSGRGTHIWPQQATVQVFTVSGTLSGFHFVPGARYNNHFCHINDSATVSDIYVNGGSMLSNATFPGVGIFRFKDWCSNGTLKNFWIHDINTTGSLTATGLIVGKYPINVLVDQWKITDCFKSGTGSTPAAFLHGGGQWRIQNGYFREGASGSCGILTYMGLSTGTWITGNTFEVRSGGAGAIKLAGLGTAGDMDNFNWSFNTFREIDGPCCKVFYMDGASGYEIHGGLISFNNFQLTCSDSLSFSPTGITRGLVFHGNTLTSSQTFTLGANAKEPVFRDSFIQASDDMYPNDVSQY